MRREPHLFANPVGWEQHLAAISQLFILLLGSERGGTRGFPKMAETPKVMLDEWDQLLTLCGW